MDQKLRYMKEIINTLNKASKAYYQDNTDIMSNMEYDKLYDELLALEKETGITLSNSPTIRVGYEAVGHLPKEKHEKIMLSLDKTKDITVLKDWLGAQTGVLSWKLDGLTIVLSYSEGQLKKAVTRGNGEIGEVVTNNAKVFANIPINIKYQGKLTLRGEAVIRYSDFYKINNEIDDIAAKYKNPRNLCSGSVRQLNNRFTAARNVHFFAFTLVSADNIDFGNSRLMQLKWLSDQGFEVVGFKQVNSVNIEAAVSWFEAHIAENDFPSDGLVLSYDDIKYGESLGTTARFPRDSIAFKWKDEIKETRLLEIKWSASRTGLVNPIAVFEPVELEGTTVSRASVHNLSIMEGLKLGVGDTITVYKANMIIPQIADNKTRSGTVKVPDSCPVCNGKTEIRDDNGVKSLYCSNADCPAKHIKSYTHFVSRDAIGIDGLSEATIEKFIIKGFIKEPADIFRIGRYRDEIVKMEGFGEKSFENLIASIEKARDTSVDRLLYSLGIPNIGLSNAKTICRHFNYDWQRIQAASFEELIKINGIGPVMAEAYVKFFNEEKNKKLTDDILKQVKFKDMNKNVSHMVFENINFVITGSLKHFKNRNELKKIIEQYGGRVTDSVTNKTDYLINNDNLSQSTKNKKAKELGVSIITEDQFIERLNSDGGIYENR